LDSEASALRLAYLQLAALKSLSVLLTAGHTTELLLVPTVRSPSSKETQSDSLLSYPDDANSEQKDEVSNQNSIIPVPRLFLINYLYSSLTPHQRMNLKKTGLKKIT